MPHVVDFAALPELPAVDEIYLALGDHDQGRGQPGGVSGGGLRRQPRRGPHLVVGRPQVQMPEQPQVQGNVITPGYLRTLRIPIVRGRDFTEADRAGRPAVVLVSEAMARWLWPNEDPVGQRLVTAFFPDGVREVAGVVKDVRERSRGAEGRMTGEARPQAPSSPA